jgi:hypothetical protein
MIKVIFLRVIPVIAAIVILFKIAVIIIVEPWVGNKIEEQLNRGSNHSVEIGEVSISIITPGIEFENIIVQSKEGLPGKQFVNGEIASLNFKGINFFKAVLKKQIEISEVIISNSIISDSILFSEEITSPMITPYSFQIGKLQLDNTNLMISRMNADSNINTYVVTNAKLTFYDFQAAKHDTLTLKMIKQFDLEAEQITTVFPDSLYTVKAEGISYSSGSNIFKANTINLNPNYERYAFASLHPFQTDCIEAQVRNVSVHNFSATSFIETGNLKLSYVEIETMDLKVFRDKRKPFHHINKKTFQELVYSFPGTLHVDSVGVINGKVVYTEHAPGANEQGYISFSNINAKIYNISNDTVYKTQTAYTELKGETYLMGKGKMDLHLKAEIFEPNNTFTLTGTLSSMDGRALNPMLEKNAFIFLTSGNIDALDFNFSANNAKATGIMTMRYHEFDIAMKNKNTDDTTAFKERFISFIGNKIMYDANPEKGEPVRTGTIDYNRDPEKFLFNYCFKAILTGMKSTLAKRQKKKEKS